MTRRFGTDGIRGRWPEPPLCPEVVRALGRVLAEEGGLVPLVRDTRESGPQVRDALRAGLGRAGRDAGVLPTPALSVLLARGLGRWGVAITASHNPWRDNGVKVLGPGGRKPTGEELEALERRLEAAISAGEGEGADPAGALPELEGAEDTYVQAVLDVLPSGPWLAGERVALDAAHGAAFRTAPRILAALGAEVVAVGVEPDGRNINEGVGALHPDALVAAVRRTGARVGIALDGDGDRCVLVDRHGPIPGEGLLLLLARPPGLVSTVMASMALEEALATRGIALERVPVGDRHVAEAMDRLGWPVGGEPSGHVLLAGGLPTGDGLLTGLAVLAGGLDVRGRLAGFRPAPQVQVALPVRERPPLEEVAPLQAALEEAAAAGARAVVRYSGTEPVLRILVEAHDATVADEVVDRIVGAVCGAGLVAG